MAKYEKHLTGNFDELLELVTDGVLNGNRVSMNVTLVGNDRDLFFSAITSGGSQAVFFKLNTLGEESFLEKLVPIVENYKKRVE